MRGAGMELLGDERVMAVIAAAVGSGAIRYDKPIGDRNMRRDLFAHAALALSGLRDMVVLEELPGRRNIDMEIADELWEVKSPEALGTGRQPLRFVEGNLRAARHQFRDCPDVAERDASVVFNNRYTALPDGLVAAELREQMRIQRVRRALYVAKDGRVERIELGW